MDALISAEFWIALGQIIVIDITLGADNAIVIALACRSLPPHLRSRGILWGTLGAIALRVVLILFALSLLALPGVKLVGAALLLLIGIKVVQPESQGAHEVRASERLWGAVKTVIVADLVMSLDNVIGIAAAAQGAPAGQRPGLVMFGLLFSVPLIVWGSQRVMRLMHRFPWIVTLGGMLLGWIAGGLALDDPLLHDGKARWGAWSDAAAALGAATVYAAGKAMARWRRVAAPPSI